VLEVRCATSAKSYRLTRNTLLNPLMRASVVEIGLVLLHQTDVLFGQDRGAVTVEFNG
jgi:hypothetical protein